MRTLKLEALAVESFETMPRAALAAGAWTQQIACLSPYCAPTVAVTCRCEVGPD